MAVKDAAGEIFRIGGCAFVVQDWTERSNLHANSAVVADKYTGRKLQIWCGVSGVPGWKVAPVLEFGNKIRVSLSPQWLQNAVISSCRVNTVTCAEDARPVTVDRKSDNA
jgi:hypothetical protein